MTRVDTRAYKRRSYAASRQPLDGSTSLPVSKRTRVLVIYCSTFSGSRYIYLSLSDYVAAAVASAGSQCGSKSVFIVCDWTVRNHRLVAVMTIYGQDCRHGKTTRHERRRIQNWLYLLRGIRWDRLPGSHSAWRLLGKNAFIRFFFPFITLQCICLYSFKLTFDALCVLAPKASLCFTLRV